MYFTYTKHEVIAAVQLLVHYLQCVQGFQTLTSADPRWLWTKPKHKIKDHVLCTFSFTSYRVYKGRNTHTHIDSICPRHESKRLDTSSRVLSIRVWVLDIRVRVLSFRVWVLKSLCKFEWKVFKHTSTSVLFYNQGTWTKMLYFGSSEEKRNPQAIKLSTLSGSST